VVAAYEGKRDDSFVTGEDHVEGLDAEGASLAVSAIDCVNCITDSIAVAKGQHRDHESAREVDLVVERSQQRRVVCVEGRARGERTTGVGRGVAEHVVEDLRRHHAVRRIQRIERRKHDRTVGVLERGCEDHRMLACRMCGCANEARTPRGWIAGHHLCEERDRRVAEASKRGRCAAGAGGFPYGCDDATGNLRLGRILRPHGIERRRFHHRVVVVKERDQYARVDVYDAARTESARGGSPLDRVG
jgi:hypothetical protein